MIRGSLSTTTTVANRTFNYNDKQQKQQKACSTMSLCLRHRTRRMINDKSMSKSDTLMISSLRSMASASARPLLTRMIVSMHQQQQGARQRHEVHYHKDNVEPSTREIDVCRVDTDSKRRTGAVMRNVFYSMAGSSSAAMMTSAKHALAYAGGSGGSNNNYGNGGDGGGGGGSFGMNEVFYTSSAKEKKKKKNMKPIDLILSSYAVTRAGMYISVNN